MKTLLLLTLTLQIFCLNAADYKPEEGSDELKKKRKKTKVVINEKLPNVLIIGDSISIGYTSIVRKQLKKKANIIHAPGNNQGTTLGLKMLDQWLGDRRWDVIHFNWGLHDLKQVKVSGTAQNSNDASDPQQADLKQYRLNLKKLLTRLKKTGAALIFATTTPYPAGVKPLRKPEYAAQYNAVAKELCAAENITVNDLYSLILPRLKELQKPVNVHFSKKGSEVLASEVSNKISQTLKAAALRQKPTQPANR